MRVLITNATSDLGVLVSQSLGAGGFEVIGTDTRALPRWLTSRHLHRLTHLPAHSKQQWQDGILKLIESTQTELFLPLCSRGVQVAVERREAIAALCRCLAPDHEAFLNAYDKRRCMATCRALGIPCAGSLSAGEAENLLRHGGRIVVKPARDRGAAQGLQILERGDDLERAITRCEAMHGDCLLQECIAGGASAVRSLTLLLDGAGRLLGSFLLQKLRHVPDTGGLTALARSCQDPALVKMVWPFFAHNRWRGAAEVECLWDERSGCFRVIEINPRFAGSLRLSAICGLNLPLLAALAATGATLRPAPEGKAYPEGVRYLAPTLFARSVMADARRNGWGRALRAAWGDAAGSGACLHSLLAEPLPILARSLIPPRPAPWL